MSCLLQDAAAAENKMKAAKSKRAKKSAEHKLKEKRKEAAEAKAREMAENRQAGLRPGQQPPSGQGDGTKGAQFTSEPQPFKLPDPGEVTSADLSNWAKLKGKKREEVLGQMREKWPEGYRRAIEAYITAIANKQNREAPQR